MTRLVIYQDAAQEYRWRLVAHNGRIIADSGESYTTRGNVRRAVMRFKLLAAKALPVMWQDNESGIENESSASS